MNRDFQNLDTITELYSDQKRVFSRGEFLKRHSNRRFSLRDIVTNLIPNDKQVSLLDIGCGNCSFIKHLQKIYPRNIYYALDVVKNDSCVGLKGIKYQLYDTTKFPDYSINFDVIFCMHVLYHLNDRRKFFNNIKRCLSPKGHIIITTKSKHTFSHLEYIFSHVISQFDLKSTVRPSNERDETRFCLENGKDILAQHFSRTLFLIKEYVIETQVITTAFPDVLQYVLSTRRYNPKTYHLTGADSVRYLRLWTENLSVDEFFIDKYVEVIYVIDRL